MKSEKDPLFTEAMRRYKASVEATQENRVDMIDDQRFASGDQWPDDVKALRASEQELRQAQVQEKRLAAVTARAKHFSPV